MMEREQYVSWQSVSLGYVMQPPAAYEKSLIWTEEPKAEAFQRGMANMRHHGSAGKLGYASAGVIATSSSSTWWRRRRRATRRRSRRRNAPRCARSATTRREG